LVDTALFEANVVGVDPDHIGDPILKIWGKSEVSRMTQVDSKRKRRGMGTGRAGSQTCKVLRFHWEKIRKIQPRFRHTLVEASINVIRESKPLNRLFNRVLYRGNVQKARVAVARKLAVIIYAMLKHNEPFKLQMT